jgi:phosphonate transport system substrate-binding protein
MKTFKYLLAAAALCGGVASAQEINFGIIATDSAAVQRERWQPLFDDMQKKTGLTIKAFYAPDYNGVIEAQRFNKVQVAWYGNKSAIEAVDRANSEVFAQIVYAGGSLGYKSLIITNKDSKVKSLEDLLANSKNYTFGNGDPNSTSGFLVPAYYIFAKNNIDPKTAFKVVRNASHGANIAAVLNNQVDAATNNTEEMEKLQATAPDKLAQIRILWTSPLIPSDPLVWRKDLDPAVKAKIKDFLLSYGKTDEHEKAVLKGIYNYEGFRESSNAQLVPIRQLEYFKDRRKAEGDTTLSEDERKKKIAEIDAKLAELGK